MKGLLASTLLLAFSVFAAPLAHAYVPATVQAFVTPQQVTFEVENIWAAPIVCQGQFFAQTISAPMGIWLDFAVGPVVAGTFGYAYLTAPYAMAGDAFIAVPQIVYDCGYL